MPEVLAPPVTAAASLGMRPLLEHDPVPGTVLGADRHTAWVGAGGTVLAVVGAGAVRLPNAVAVPGSVGIWSPGEPALVGGRRVVAGAATVEVVRWWDPRPALVATSATAVRRRVAGIAGAVPPCDDAGLGRALRWGGRSRIAATAHRLLGRGPGLTPLGDDILCGALTGLALLGPAARSRRADRRLGALAGVVDAGIAGRTTALSAALLRHARRGEVAAAAAPLLQALAGRGDPETALAVLLEVGHTSGTGLAHGIVLAGEAL